MTGPGASAGAGWSGGRVFVGRRRERALLRQLLREAAASRQAMPVVTGLAGVGKTALLRWFTAEATAAGALVLRATAAGSLAPFATLSRLFAPLPEVAQAIPGREAAIVAADTLAATARRRLVAVVLDDLQELEPESVAVLDEVLTALDDVGTRQPLGLVVAVAARDPVDHETLAGRLLRLDTAYAVPLGGLDEHEVFGLVEATSGRRPDSTTVRRLAEETGGLPLLIEGALEGGTSPTDSPASSIARRPARVLTVADTIGRRLDEVAGPARELLQHAALLGDPWTLDDLALVAGRAHDEVEAAVDGASGARLVHRDRDGVRFSHPLVRSELADRLTPERRRALHRTIADRMIEAGGEREPALPAPAVVQRAARATASSRGRALTDEELARAVGHLLRGQPGTPPATISDLGERAGRLALSRRWWQQASWFLEAAADGLAAAGHQDAGRTPAADEIARRLLDAGRAAYLDHDAERGEQLLTRAIDHARRAADELLRLEAATYLARLRGGAHYRLGQRIDLGELEEALAATSDGDLPRVVAARATLAEMLFVSGESERALAIVQSAREAARGGTDQEAEAALGRVDFAEGIHRLGRLELDAATACLRRSLRRASGAGDGLTEVHSRSRLALAQLMEGSVSEAREALGAVEEQAASRGFWAEVGFAVALRAFADTLAGHPTAVDVEHASGLWTRTGFPYIGALLLPVVQADDARTRGTGASAGSDRRSPRRADLAPTSPVAALAAVEANDVGAARARTDEAAWRHGFRGPVTQNNGVVAVALVEVGDLLHDSELIAHGHRPLQAMYERGAMVVPGWPALVPRLLATVARHQGDLTAARRFLDHAFDLADRGALPFERARALVEHGRLAAAAGASAAEVGAGLVEATKIFGGLSMHGWVARCDALAQSLRLPLAGVEGVSRDRTIFTGDVVGSTAANVRLGDALYLEQLRLHDRLVRARLHEFAGLEIKHTGDGLNAAFDDPDDATRCALAILADFERWQADEPDLALRIRCGLARGPVIASGGDFFGLVQSKAARLCDLAGPGELLATRDVMEGVHADLRLDALGPTTLRGLPEPVELFRVSLP